MPPALKLAAGQGRSAQSRGRLPGNNVARLWRTAGRPALDLVFDSPAFVLELRLELLIGTLRRRAMPAEHARGRA